MFEKSKLKKKSKCLKKPLELKNNISETLAHNTRAPSILKKETIAKPHPCKPKPNPQLKDKKLQTLYHQVELQHKSQSDSDNSEQMLVADLQRREDEEEQGGKRRDKKAMLFSHLVKDSTHLSRKLSVLEEKVNQNIKKYSVQSKIKQMEGKRTPPLPQDNCSMLPKALERSVARLSQEGASHVRLSNMQITRLSLLKVKQQLGFSGKLRVLDLAYNNLTNKSMTILADILSQNAIEELSVKWNQLTYEGAMQLIDVVTYNINLTSLDLSYNKLTNSSAVFLNSWLRLFSENRYLAHLNLEMCHLSDQQCTVLARAYNLNNQSILCIHFKGNSHYYVNKLGYITKNAVHEEETLLSPHELSRLAKPDHLPSYCSRYLICEDCCWLCQQWVGQVFKFPQEVLPMGLNSQHINEYFIHLSCYEYQPIKMAPNECINSVQTRRDCKRLEWSNYEVYVAQIPVPNSKDIKYFFTLNGKAFINPNDPSAECNQLVSFEVFDVFSGLYATDKIPEKYSVFVQKMNTRSKDELGYNKQKKLNCDISVFNQKESFNNENKKALRAILTKERKPSIHPSHFEPLPRISKTKPNSPAHSRAASSHQAPPDHFNVVVNIRKCKQKPLPLPESEKYMSLGITPRNKQFLFNYQFFYNSGMTLDDVASRQAQFMCVEAEYFGSFKPTYIQRFLRQRQAIWKEDQFMDRFKILTRKYFNSNELFFSDVFSFLYSTFVSLDTPSQAKQPKQVERSKNKSVKFVSPSKESKLSILINSEKMLEGKIATQMSSSLQKGIERRALSMNCINDKYQLSKLRAMPSGSIHTLQSNAPSTDKTIASLKNIPNDHTPTLLQLSLEALPHPIDLAEEFYARYITLSTRYAREKKVIFQLINSCERNCEKEKLKELNEIILTYNYYKLSQFYECTVQKGLEALFSKANSFAALICYVGTAPPPLPYQRKSSILSSSLDGRDEVQDLQAIQKQIRLQSTEESFLSLASYLSSEEHPIKILKRTEGAMMKSSKKRKGKYGRSLKNIKEELLREQTKVVLPADSDKFLHEIEQEELNNHYNDLIRQLNTLTDTILSVLNQLIDNYLKAHDCGEEQPIIEQWLSSQLSSRIAVFISQMLVQCRSGQMARVKERTVQICQHFVLNSVLELVRASLMLGSSVLQQNLKEYQFISPFHSYEFIIGIEITKLTYITRAIQDAPALLRQHLTDVLRLLSDTWKQDQLTLLTKEKLRKQQEANRKLKRIKTINESLERALPSQELIDE